MTPRTIRIAGVLVTVQAIVGLIFVAALVIRGAAPDLGGIGTLGRSETYGEAGYFGLVVVAVLAVGIGLWRGKHWARTPALLMQLLLLGNAFYAAIPSQRPLIGLVIAVPAAAVLWFLFNREGRVWSLYGGAAPDADYDAK